MSAFTFGIIGNLVQRASLTPEKIIMLLFNQYYIEKSRCMQNTQVYKKHYNLNVIQFVNISIVKYLS